MLVFYSYILIASHSLSFNYTQLYNSGDQFKHWFPFHWGLYYVPTWHQFIIYVQYAWPVWPSPGTRHSSLCQTQLSPCPASQRRAPECPHVSPGCDTRPGPERVSVLSWLSPGTHRYTNAISDQNITSLTSLMTETCFKQSWQIVMVSWQESRSRWERLPWGQVNKSVLCDKLDVPDSDWIDHISR